MRSILDNLPTLLAAVFSVGGVGSILLYFQNKPKTDAEAKKINSEVVVTFAEGWKAYSQKLEDRLTQAEDRSAKAETRVRELEELVDQLDREHKSIIQKKDAEIARLNARIDDLENELERYKGSNKNQSSA